MINYETGKTAEIGTNRTNKLKEPEFSASFQQLIDLVYLSAFNAYQQRKVKIDYMRTVYW